MRNQGTAISISMAKFAEHQQSKLSNFEGAWEVKRGDLFWEDAESQFLRSRKLGIYGATLAQSNPAPSKNTAGI